MFCSIYDIYSDVKFLYNLYLTKKIEGDIERCCEKHLKTKLLICEKYGN